MAKGLNGERLKEIRKDHGDTQEDFAKKIDFSLSTVRKWEQGSVEPSLDTLKRICRLYSVSSDYLLDLIDLDPLIYRDKFRDLPIAQQNALRLFEQFLTETRISDS